MVLKKMSLNEKIAKKVFIKTKKLILEVGDKCDPVDVQGL